MKILSSLKVTYHVNKIHLSSYSRFLKKLSGIFFFFCIRIYQDLNIYLRGIFTVLEKLRNLLRNAAELDRNLILQDLIRSILRFNSWG